MTFNLAALEKALSPKGRQPRQNLTPTSSLSKQALLDEAINLASDVQAIYSRDLRTRHAGVSYRIRNRFVSAGYYHALKIEDVPRQVLQRLVTNGRRLCKNYYQIIDRVVQLNPGLALEANLEGKTGYDVMRFVYDRRLDQIGTLLHSRILSPEVNLLLTFRALKVQPPLGEGFEISIDWAMRGQPLVSGVSLSARTETEMIRLVQFLTYFEQVTNEMNRQLNTIVIRKE